MSLLLCAIAGRPAARAEQIIGGGAINVLIACSDLLQDEFPLWFLAADDARGRSQAGPVRGPAMRWLAGGSTNDARRNRCGLRCPRKEPPGLPNTVASDHHDLSSLSLSLSLSLSVSLLSLRVLCASFYKLSERPGTGPGTVRLTLVYWSSCKLYLSF